MNPFDVLLTVLSFVSAVAAGLVILLVALVILARALTWLSVLWMRWRDPAAYERFRIIHNLRKGAWKRR